MLNVCVLGATGSIGLSTLDVISRHPERYNVHSLTAFNKWQALYQQCILFSPDYAVLVDEDAAEQLASHCAAAGLSTQVLSGVDALEVVAAHIDVDIVMAAIVGAAGLQANLSAAKKGKKVLLANKESLVMSGELFMKEVERSSATLLPIDSEHNAIFQSLPLGYGQDPAYEQQIEKILLTASGGPFRGWGLDALSKVTPKQAVKHPNWSMGQKISVDSATLMNKGLELIEACWLFDVKPSQIEVVVHPESIIHSMVQYIDGSVICQMGNPDMRTPIAYGLAWPERIESGVALLDIIATARLDFEPPDYQRFPCLRLATEAIETGLTAVTVLNAANEIAVDAFLNQRIRFTDIADIIERVLEQSALVEPSSLALVQQADLQARELALRCISEY